eukprot:scaffold578_cov167-Amphora_coffeaeformis.AAC.14
MTGKGEYTNNQCNVGLASRQCYRFFSQCLAPLLAQEGELGVCGQAGRLFQITQRKRCKIVLRALPHGFYSLYHRLYLGGTFE